jgi:TolB-like protein/tetratricopeptide (TPR) repeat protein
MTLTGSDHTIREYHFGECRVVPSLREVWRGDDLVGIEPKAFDLLVYLVQHRDRAVSKDELQDQIWPGSIVTEASLTRCVMKARRAIGDNAGQDAIATVRGHGYRFADSVKEIIEETGSPPAKLSLPDKPSLVVLPLVNLSSDPAQEYFSEGITEDIITELSRFRSLFVIGRQSAFSFKGRNLTTREIAGELGVAYVVDGSLQRSGDRIRFTVRLVDARDDAQMWAERYDRDVEDILLVQEEVARTVAATIGGRVEATRGRQRIDSNVFESYDYLLQAQALYYDFSKVASGKARALLERAIDIDPDNARALAILAAVHSMDSWSFWSEDNEKSKQLALELGRRSIALDDTDSLAQALFAEILFDCDQRELADHHFQRALRLNPNDIAARALYASKCRCMGRMEDAIEHITVAKRLDPFGLLWIPLIEGAIMFAARRYEDAANALYAMTSPPNEARYVLIAALGRLGRIEEALQVREKFFELAREEMPDYPGEKLLDWEPIIRRMQGSHSSEDHEHLLESLKLVGWD